MRTFIALNLPASQRVALVAALAPLRDRELPVRWAENDGLHLTLKFLGEIDRGQIAALGDTLERVATKHEQLELRLGGFGAFPSLRRASVLWVGVAADPKLTAFQREMETALFTLGYPREQRAFRPHITVARTRGGAREPDVSRFPDRFQFNGSGVVATVDLMRSHTSPAGARYEPLLKARLGGVSS